MNLEFQKTIDLGIDLDPRKNGTICIDFLYLKREAGAAHLCKLRPQIIIYGMY